MKDVKQFDNHYGLIELFSPTIRELGFNEAMKLYEQTYMIAHDTNDFESTDYSFMLQVFANMVTNSVLKKLVNVSYNPLLVELRDSLYHDVKNLCGTVRHGNNEYSYQFNDYGEQERVLNEVVSQDFKECFKDISDGFDLVQEAIVSLEKHSKRCMQKYGFVSLECLDTIRVLNKKTFTEKKEARQYKDDTRPYISRVFKDVRDYIDANKGIGSFNYIYYNDIDPQTGETYYKRFERISAMTSKGVVGATIKKHDMIVYENILTKIENGDFTKRQLEIISLKLKGYSHEAIAQKLGLKAKSGITKHLQAIALKLLDGGYFPKYTHDFLLCNTEALKKYTQSLIKHYETMYIVEEANILNGIENPIFSDPEDTYQAYIKDIVYKTIEAYYFDEMYDTPSGKSFVKQIDFFIG